MESNNTLALKSYSTIQNQKYTVWSILFKGQFSAVSDKTKGKRWECKETNAVGFHSSDAIPSLKNHVNRILQDKHHTDKQGGNDIAKAVL